jgi:lipopolysaccharide biosynthesis glycosyltransferase
VFFEASVDNNLQAKTDQIMCNMLLRAINRAIERAYNTIHFIDIFPHQLDNPSPAVKMIQELGATR